MILDVASSFALRWMWHIEIKTLYHREHLFKMYPKIEGDALTEHSGAGSENDSAQLKDILPGKRLKDYWKSIESADSLIY